MAKAKITASDDFVLALSRCATDIEEIAKKAIYAGAKIVADTMRVNLEAILSDEATGQLVEALGITPISLMGGEWTAHIGFDGYDTKGVAFQLIARALESGASGRPKKQFAKKTLSQTRKKVEAVMSQVIDDEMKRIFG
ncbi:hypothetical protein [Acetobacterium sp.]|uniref:hypothetical protein n=1 Tax=Acetobacterium sp. TaxID=1872094 RepID=UPI00271D1BEA|nr:hypothetical protein [Acetobacterium sp.]MDO9492665.1 hypothetical protein [Acetobacterium sp.]